jgi:glyoxylase-like metal-dependent hydrolase (beta-lactamase superfamily II)
VAAAPVAGSYSWSRCGIRTGSAAALQSAVPVRSEDFERRFVYIKESTSPAVAPLNDSQTSFNRRNFLAALGGAAAAAAMPGATLAQVRADALTISALNGLRLITGAGANITTLNGPEGALLVDGGLAEYSSALLDVLAESAAHSVRVLFNSNWRPEHTGSNQYLRAAETDVIAHENTKLWLAGDFLVDWEHAHYEPQPSAALPNRTFYTSGKIEFGGVPVEYGHLPRAHTDGDLYVSFPNDNVLVVGDLLSIDSYPIVDYSTGGWIGGLHDATERLLELADGATLIVPAAGPAQNRTALQVQLDLCAAARQRVAEAYRQGHSLREFIASEPTKKFDTAFGDPTLFLTQVYRGAWNHIRELGGVI